MRKEHSDNAATCLDQEEQAKQRAIRDTLLHIDMMLSAADYSKVSCFVQLAIERDSDSHKYIRDKHVDALLGKYIEANIQDILLAIGRQQYKQLAPVKQTALTKLIRKLLPTKEEEMI